jgi:hypothetical protein
VRVGRGDKAKGQTARAFDDHEEEHVRLPHIRTMGVSVHRAWSSVGGRGLLLLGCCTEHGIQGEGPA